MDTLKWNVLLPDINNLYFNVFNSVRFREYLMNLKAIHKKDATIDLQKEITNGLMYSFWAKAEYEIVVKNFVGCDTQHKIDVYTQVLMNYDKFYDYLIQNWKKIPARTYAQQRIQK